MELQSSMMLVRRNFRQILLQDADAGMNLGFFSHVRMPEVPGMIAIITHTNIQGTDRGGHDS